MRDEDIHSWHIDPGITWSGGEIRNETQLLVNTVGSYDHQPDARCAIPNLFFGGDHVRSNIDLTTTADDPAARAEVFPLVSLPVFEPAKRLDADRYRAGMPHILDG
ncbi:hypothetical protein [Nocardia australiensis]|uniref:hypothetical protein n=1 Tax=Nocardia australiensis TaxID=2887191 RepID=UPI0027E08CE8|nr:hypothetical protein [Nocardia australiensis]